MVYRAPLPARLEVRSFGFLEQCVVGAGISQPRGGETVVELLDHLSDDKSRAIFEVFAEPWGHLYRSFYGQGQSEELVGQFVRMDHHRAIGACALPRHYYIVEDNVRWYSIVVQRA